MKLEKHDLELLEEKGITPEKLEAQLENLKTGFPYLKIEGPATPGHGLTVATPELEEQSEAIWQKYLASGATVLKMVPASGAASRMFKDLFAFFNSDDKNPKGEFLKTFFDNAEDFAFYGHLNFICMQLFGKSIGSLVKEKRYKEVLEALLTANGLNYGSLPKGLLLFHKIMGGARTPFEEHLAEGALYACGKDGKVHLHFTVSEDHLPLFQAKLEENKRHLENLYDVEYDVTFSVQKPSTDTVAATKDGDAFRTKEGKLFFRPGGHGALIENLNDLDADVIFIKNIDNVVPDSQKDVTVRWKKILGGVLVAAKQVADRYCKRLAEGVPTDEEMAEMLTFLRTKLCVTGDNADKMAPEDRAAYLMRKLNRPMRVCGMVKNEGEPGGGPFLAYNPDGTVSPQILESTQIDPKNKEAVEMLKSSTHFNPVDLAVSTRDYQGKKFNLPDFVDPATAFISEKSVEGTEIKALELPGLWNGAMSDWNTILLEVPAATFNPVKTVNDLLRPAHR
ncbi:MAG: DUF4301 family protein [Bacteroides sp.]|nr:DUF4301 family protein [Bacteroides sp.]